MSQKSFFKRKSIEIESDDIEHSQLKDKNFNLIQKRVKPNKAANPDSKTLFKDTLSSRSERTLSSLTCHPEPSNFSLASWDNAVVEWLYSDSTMGKLYSVFEDWRIIETVENHRKTKPTGAFPWKNAIDPLTNAPLLEKRRSPESMSKRYKDYLKHLGHYEVDKIKDFCLQHSLEEMKSHYCSIVQYGKKKRIQAFLELLEKLPQKFPPPSPFEETRVLESKSSFSDMFDKNLCIDKSSTTTNYGDPSTGSNLLSQSLFEGSQNDDYAVCSTSGSQWGNQAHPIEYYENISLNASNIFGLRRQVEEAIFEPNLSITIDRKKMTRVFEFSSETETEQVEILNGDSRMPTILLTKEVHKEKDGNSHGYFELEDISNSSFSKDSSVEILN